MKELDTYQEFTRTTAIYPKDRVFVYLTAGIAEEAGEVAGKFKKSVRDNWQYDVFKERVAAELGDVLWYVARYADELGIPLSEIASMNQAKLTGRKDNNTIQGEGDNR